MIKKILILLFFFICSSHITGQEKNNFQKANEYYKSGQFNKAAELFEVIYKKERINIYKKYVDCLIKIKEYKKAEKIIKSHYKKSQNPTDLIELGFLYAEKGDFNEENKIFNSVLDKIKQNKKYSASAGDSFYRKNKYSFAIKSYLHANKFNSKPSHYIKIANCFAYLNDLKSMYETITDLLHSYPNYLRTAKNMLIRTINDDELNNNNIILKKILLKEIQKNNSYEISKLIIWLFLQEKNFQDALKYEISIDKQILNNIDDIITIIELADKNQEYDIAIEGLDYILQHSKINSIQYQFARVKTLEIKYSLIATTKVISRKEIEQLSNDHKKLIEEIGINSNTVITLTNYCRILSSYLEKNHVAVELLNKTINDSNLNQQDQAICKLELGRILISSDKMWEAILIFSQVEKKFKNDIIGQQAKFEKIKINFYQGDFQWAQTQLDVLKLSTSKLIANDAMKLSLLISDNLNLDTTNTALASFAKAELLNQQNKHFQAIDELNKIEKNFPNHSLIDEGLYKKFEIFMKLENYENAIKELEKITTQYYFDILHDDALFYQAQVYEKFLGNNEQAVIKYEELLLTHSNSIYTNKARERYRLLRPNKLLKL